MVCMVAKSCYLSCYGLPVRLRLFFSLLPLSTKHFHLQKCPLLLPAHVFLVFSHTILCILLCVRIIKMIYLAIYVILKPANCLAPMTMHWDHFIPPNSDVWYVYSMKLWTCICIFRYTAFLPHEWLHVHYLCLCVCMYLHACILYTCVLLTFD